MINNMFFNNGRDYNDPKYKTWRYSVFILYNFTCALCNRSGKGIKLEAHHIVRWCENEKLRYKLSNGCCLCTECHRMVTGHEKKYEPIFRKKTIQKIKEMRIARNKASSRDSYQKTKKRQQNKFITRKKSKKWRPSPRSGY